MNWYCIHTKPLKEDVASRHCGERLGLETFLPRFTRTKRIRRVRRTVVKPLFPRYFFARLDLGTHFRAVHYAPEVNGIVSIGGGPAVVAESLVNDLRDWAANLVDISLIEPQINIGSRIEVCDGPFMGLEAVVLQEMRDEERIVILLDAIESGARVVINRSHVLRVG